MYTLPELLQRFQRVRGIHDQNNWPFGERNYQYSSVLRSRLAAIGRAEKRKNRVSTINGKTMFAEPHLLYFLFRTADMLLSLGANVNLEVGFHTYNKASISWPIAHHICCVDYTHQKTVFKLREQSLKWLLEHVREPKSGI